jgi:signal transduction histidine kinase
MLSIQKGLLKRLLIRYGFTVSTVAAALLLHQVLTAYVGPGLPTYITFYPAVMLVAIVAGFWPGFVATVVSAVVADYYLLPPLNSLILVDPRIENLTDAVALIFFSGMGVFISAVAEFYRRARQRAQESSLELTKANEALRNLSTRLLSAQEDERKRIAGELHDTIGSCMNAIKFKVETVRQQIGNTANVARDALNTVILVVQEGIEECRRIQQDLRPSILDDLGLLATLSWFCRRYQTIYSEIQIEQEICIEEGDVPLPLKTVIFRVTQEAMNNIAKYSKADLARLSLGKIGDRMELVIRDNGQGFNLEKVISQKSTKKGLGLSSMKERTELSGGSFAIESAEGKGTIIRASWPLGGKG